ncbi:hypothetical protein [Maribacter aquivivus]|uniref:hypothetical protein n=1 Tax=Maribacter aquivivus TaxID=228958 RepID=UPI002493EE32|nr:hypothetical protein [Maribacter aquivivus]
MEAQTNAYFDTDIKTGKEGKEVEYYAELFVDLDNDVVYVEYNGPDFQYSKKVYYTVDDVEDYTDWDESYYIRLKTIGDKQEEVGLEFLGNEEFKLITKNRIRHFYTL